MANCGCHCPVPLTHTLTRCEHCDNEMQTFACVTASIEGEEPILRLRPAGADSLSSLCGVMTIAPRCCFSNVYRGGYIPNESSSGLTSTGVISLVWRVRHDCSAVDFALCAYTDGGDGRPWIWYSTSGEGANHSDGLANGFGWGWSDGLNGHFLGPEPGDRMTRLEPWPLNWSTSPQTVGPYTIEIGCAGLDPAPLVSVCCLRILGDLFAIVHPPIGDSQPFNGTGVFRRSCTPPALDDYLFDCLYYGGYEPNNWCGKLFDCSVEDYQLMWAVSPDLSTISLGLYRAETYQECEFTGEVPANALYHAFVPFEDWWLNDQTLTLTAYGEEQWGHLDGLPEEIVVSPCGSTVIDPPQEPCWNEITDPLFVDIENIPGVLSGGTFAMLWTGVEYSSGYTPPTGSGNGYKVRVRFRRNVIPPVDPIDCGPGAELWDLFLDVWDESTDSLLYVSQTWVVDRGDGMEPVGCVTCNSESHFEDTGVFIENLAGAPVGFYNCDLRVYG